jgi:hypothetical protein
VLVCSCQPIHKDLLRSWGNYVSHCCIQTCLQLPAVLERPTLGRCSTWLPHKAQNGPVCLT